MTYNKIALAAVTMCMVLSASIASAQTTQTTFKFKPVVRAGDPAPVPPQVGSILNFAFNDQAQVVVIADRGIVLKSGAQITPIVGPGDPAPGGGIFFVLDVPTLG